MKRELVMRRSFDEIDESLDQFYVRNIDGKLMKERLVRLPGGMPSTVRESEKETVQKIKKQKNRNKCLLL